ncbi:hypothetical protein D9758_019105 [Tetrapyrgos nigripes]|uniref:F-box domain-containing protein n=1 Tax=Tetrapyrgos nigripes TaxID=182062 RepID=A0A8H5ERH7_9AGAR|nr:hypothetical protein D9758_019105 [Tetrapyrgos nigripes]
MHSALQIPEILDQIISHLEKDDQKRCAPVCQLWSEVALDHIWRRIVYYSNLKKLSSAAKEINTERPASHTSNSPLTVKALNRLKLKYYARIRTLDLGYSGSWVVLRELMSNSGLTSTLFPNLQCLDCQDQIFDEEFSILILHSGIKSFSVWCSDGLSDILHLTQTITDTNAQPHFLVDIPSSTSGNMPGPLATLLENLTSLEHAGNTSFKDISPILWV